MVKSEADGPARRPARGRHVVARAPTPFQIAMLARHELVPAGERQYPGLDEPRARRKPRGRIDDAVDDHVAEEGPEAERRPHEEEPRKERRARRVPTRHARSRRG